MSVYYQDEHVTLYHGDCHTEHREWLNADVLVTDPPYGRAWKQGDTAKHRGWSSNAHKGIANDDSTAARDAALAAWDGPGIIFGDLLIQQPKEARQVLIWSKGPNAGFRGTFGGFRRDVEAIYLTGNWTARTGGTTSVLTSAGPSAGNLTRPTGHPHTKPIDVMEELIRRAPTGVIADPFAGSGSTLVAAKNLGRRAIGIELEERYCEIIAKRLSQGVLPFEESA